MHHDADIDQILARADQDQAEGPAAQQSTKNYINNKIAKKFSPKTVLIFSIIGYIVPLAFFALSSSTLFIAEGTATTLKVALSWIANIGYLSLGFLTGLVASNDTIKSCENLLTEAGRKNEAKKYLPSLSRFNFLEVIQWILASLILLSLGAMTIGYTFGNNFSNNLSLTLSNFCVMLASAIRAMENGWLAYRQSQIKKIADADKKENSKKQIRIIKELREELDERRKQQQYDLREFELTVKDFKNFISNGLNEFGKRIVSADSFIVWIKNGLTLDQLQAINQVEFCANIESKVISYLIEHSKLTITQGLSLSSTKRELFDTLYEKRWINKINPADILELVDNAINSNLLENRHVKEAIAENLFDPVIAVQLQAHHVEELEKQNTAYLLLKMNMIRPKQFSNLTFNELIKVNQLKIDRAVKTFEVFRLAEFIDLPLIKIQAINSDAMLSFIMPEYLKLQLVNINSEDDLQRFIHAHHPPSSSQQLKM